MTKETALKQAAKDYLAIMGIESIPILQGLGAVKGIPDRIAIYKGRFIALEFKRPGGKLSDHQEKMKGRIEYAGALWWTIDDIQQLIDYVKALKKSIL